MKYVAPVKPHHDPSDPARDADADEPGDGLIVELSGVEHDVLPGAARRWLGVLIGIAVAAVGYGFLSHGSDRPSPGQGHRSSTAEATPWATPDSVGLSGASTAQDDQPIVVTT